MSGNTEQVRELALQQPCPHCRAEAGVWCKTKTGRRTSPWLHSMRERAYWEAWRLGYDVGLTDGMNWNGGKA